MYDNPAAYDVSVRKCDAASYCVCLVSRYVCYFTTQVHEHPGLRERHMGVLQGLTYAEAPAQQPLAWVALQSDSSSTRIPGGESLIDLQERITATLLEIASWYPGEEV